MSAPITRPNTRSRRIVQKNKPEVKVTPSPPSSKRRRGATTSSTTPTKSKSAELTTTATTCSTSPASKQTPPQAPTRRTAPTTKNSEVLVNKDKLICNQQGDLPVTSQPLTVDPKLPFKDPQYQFDKAVGRRKSKGWKSLRQIIAAERALPANQGKTTYGSIDAPPSFKPAKKYSDLSGLSAKYTDPQTKLRYTNAEEYSRISLLPSDIVNGLLSLRKANSVVP